MLPTLLLLVACASRPATLRTTMVGSGLDQLDVAGPVGEWAPAPDQHALVPTGEWVRAGDVVAFTYVDPSEGLSAQWEADGKTHIRRLSWAPVGLTVLTDDERAALGLPERPDWLARYGDQPAAGSLYGHRRDDPAMRLRLHPDYPDDLRVVVGDTSFYEIVWARILTCDGPRCDAALLNQPDRVPGLAIGTIVRFDLTGVADDRLPLAGPPGAPLDETLLQALATRPEFAGLLQDPAAWEIDVDSPPETRLVPLGSWGWVGGEVVWFFLDQKGPSALVVSRDPPQGQSLTWTPRGYRPMSDDERVALGLPERVEVGGAPEQPPPGPWGTWRVDEATSWLFKGGNDPDVVSVVVGGQIGELRVSGCDGMRCWGVLAEAVGDFAEGTPMDIVHVLPPDVDRAAFIPVAEVIR